MPQIFIRTLLNHARHPKAASGKAASRLQAVDCSCLLEGQVDLIHPSIEYKYGFEENGTAYRVCDISHQMEHPRASTTQEAASRGASRRAPPYPEAAIIVLHTICEKLHIAAALFRD